MLAEQTRFLLNELVRLYETDGLLSSDDTVVVAASSAWPEYRRLHAHVCQPNRAFREGLTHFGFYAVAQIQPVAPRIDAPEIAVPSTEAEARRRQARGQDRVAQIIRTALAEGTHSGGDAHDVILLTGPDDPATIRLAHPVINDTITAAGKPWAWTLAQRHTRLDPLTSGVTRTSQL